MWSLDTLNLNMTQWLWAQWIGWAGCPACLGICLCHSSAGIGIMFHQTWLSNWVLGIEFGSSCLQGKHVTLWAFCSQHSWLNEIYKWVFGTFFISITFCMKNLFIYETKNSCQKGLIDKHVCLKCVIFLSLLTHIAHLNAK